jgi:hypothetical protein
MYRILGLAAVGALLAGGAVQAYAQSPTPGTSTTTSPTLQQSAQDPTGRPLFYISKLPVGVNAPVAAPYSNSAMQDFGGQPGTSRDAVIEQATGRE